MKVVKYIMVRVEFEVDQRPDPEDDFDHDAKCAVWSAIDEYNKESEYEKIKLDYIKDGYEIHYY